MKVPAFTHETISWTLEVCVSRTLESGSEWQYPEFQAFGPDSGFVSGTCGDRPGGGTGW